MIHWPKSEDLTQAWGFSSKLREDLQGWLGFSMSGLCLKHEYYKKGSHNECHEGYQLRVPLILLSFSLDQEELCNELPGYFVIEFWWIDKRVFLDSLERRFLLQHISILLKLLC